MNKTERLHDLQTCLDTVHRDLSEVIHEALLEETYSTTKLHVHCIRKEDGGRVLMAIPASKAIQLMWKILRESMDKRILAVAPDPENKPPQITSG